MNSLMFIQAFGDSRDILLQLKDVMKPYQASQWPVAYAQQVIVPI